MVNASTATQRHREGCQHNTMMPSNVTRYTDCLTMEHAVHTLLIAIQCIRQTATDVLKRGCKVGHLQTVPFIVSPSSEALSRRKPCTRRYIPWQLPCSEALCVMPLLSKYEALRLPVSSFSAVSTPHCPLVLGLMWRTAWRITSEDAAGVTGCYTVSTGTHRLLQPWTLENSWTVL